MFHLKRLQLFCDAESSSTVTQKSVDTTSSRWKDSGSWQGFHPQWVSLQVAQSTENKSGAPFASFDPRFQLGTGLTVSFPLERALARCWLLLYGEHGSPCWDVNSLSLLWVCFFTITCPALFFLSFSCEAEFTCFKTLRWTSRWKASE